MNKNKIAYAELYSFINSLPPKEYYKIPNEIIDYINWHREYNYKFNYDPKKTIYEQNFSREAIALILKLYLEFFADEKEKQNIYANIYRNEFNRNLELKEKYNPDNLF